MYEDFLYEMENGMYYHFEFESDSISTEDFRRFREYEASTARIYKAPVVTYVICSSEVRLHPIPNTVKSCISSMGSDAGQIRKTARLNNKI